MIPVQRNTLTLNENHMKINIRLHIWFPIVHAMNEPHWTFFESNWLNEGGFSVVCAYFVSYFFFVFLSLSFSTFVCVSLVIRFFRVLSCVIATLHSEAKSFVEFDFSFFFSYILFSFFCRFFLFFCFRLLTI